MTNLLRSTYFSVSFRYFLIFIVCMVCMGSVVPLPLNFSYEPKLFYQYVAFYLPALVITETGKLQKVGMYISYPIFIHYCPNSFCIVFIHAKCIKNEFL